MFSPEVAVRCERNRFGFVCERLYCVILSLDFSVSGDKVSFL